MTQNISETIEKLEQKKRETKRFIKKYNERGMNDLEEYYKGACWALEFSLKLIKS